MERSFNKCMFEEMVASVLLDLPGRLRRAHIQWLINYPLAGPGESDARHAKE